MPEISRFYGIVIKVFWDDHAPPHFHAEYSGHVAVIDIRSLAILHGRLPARALGLTMEWASLHRDELLEIWDLAMASAPLKRVDPLP